MPNLWIKPNKIQNTGDAPASVEVRFSLNPNLDGSKVRLLVLDEGQYCNGPYARDYEALKAKDEGSTRTIVDDAPANPEVTYGTGVLLKLEGRVKREGTSWWIQDVGSVVHMKGGLGEVTLKMVTSRADAPAQSSAPVGTFGYSGMPQDAASSGRLIVRMILLAGADGPVPHGWPEQTQLLSFLSPSHNPNKTPLPQVDLKAFQVHKGTALQKPGGLAGAAEAKARFVSPDLTGLYEAVPESSQDEPLLMVQINQAGRAAVGWFGPPRRVETPEFPMKVGTYPPDAPRRGGFRVELFKPQPADGHPLDWWGGGGSDLDVVDPSGGVSGDGPGRLIVHKAAAGATDQKIELVFMKDGKAVGRFVLRRYDTVTRWSNRHIKAAGRRDPRLEAELIARQVAPVSRRALERIDKSASSENKELVEALTKWVEAGTGTGGIDTTERHAARLRIARVLHDLFAGKVARDREVLVEQFHVYARQNQLSVGGEVHTVWRWLNRVMEQEFDVHRRKHPDEKDRHIYDTYVPKGFVLARLPIPGHFVYTMKLKGVGGNVKFIVELGATHFGATFSKGKRKERAGFPVSSWPIEAAPANEWNPKLEFTGVFTEVGAGLSWGGKFGAGGGGGSFPDEVPFETGLDIEQHELEGAKFSVKAINGPGAGGQVGPIKIEIKQVSTALMILTTKTGLQLQAEVDKMWDLDGGVAYQEPAVKGDVAIGGLSMGWGYLYTNAPAKGRPPVKEDKVSKEVAEEQVRLDSKIGVEFVKDEATLTDASKFDFEADLAAERVLLTSGGGRLSAWGFASPEGTTKYNRLLSQLRAEEMVRTVKNAFPPGTLTVPDDQILAHGNGEEPSWKYLLDPPSAGNVGPPERRSREEYSAAELERIEREEQHEYHKWRRTHLVIDGSVVVGLTSVKR